MVLHEQYRELELNQAFAAYATAAGFRIHACEGYDPESKGKVEAGVKYVKGNALAGEVFDDWGHLEAHVRQWLDEVANIRRHGTTGEAPQVRFECDEQAQLGPYLTPASLAPQASAETRKVDKTGLLSWRANKYSAPMAYQGSRVGVCAEAGELVLLDLESGEEIARQAGSTQDGDEGGGLYADLAERGDDHEHHQADVDHARGEAHDHWVDLGAGHAAGHQALYPLRHPFSDEEDGNGRQQAGTVLEQELLAMLEHGPPVGRICQILHLLHHVHRLRNFHCLFHLFTCHLAFSLGSLYSLVVYSWYKKSPSVFRTY